MILDDPALVPMDSHLSNLGLPKGREIDLWKAALMEDADVKLIWIVAPLAAAGFYLWFRSKQENATAPAGGGGTGTVRVLPLAPGESGGTPLQDVTEPGTDAGTAPSLPIHVPPAWSRADLAALVNRIATSEGYNRPALAHAIIAVESSWDPNAINIGDHAPFNAADEGDSVGLMQIKVYTARPYTPWVENTAQLLDPETNVTAGIRFLADLARKWESEYGIAGVIQMYNLGETRFRNGDRNAAYLAKVQTALASYRL